MTRVLWAAVLLVLTSFGPVRAQGDDPALYEAAKKEGKVVWYVGGPLEGMNAVAGQFQKEFPGIAVETMRLVGVAQYQRFMDETGAKKYLADVLQNTDYPSIASLIEDGHVAPWRVPTFERIPAQFRIKESAYAQYVSTNGIIYNVNKVTPAEVAQLETGWEAVLDPRFRGRFSVSPMKCGVCYAPVHLFMDPKYRDRYGPAFLEKIAAQKPASYSEVLVTIDRVIAGEQDFTIAGWEAAGAVKLIDGAPIRWVFPRPTPEFGNSWLAISKYAPHPNASRLFLNWLVGDKGADRDGAAVWVQGDAAGDPGPAALCEGRLVQAAGRDVSGGLGALGQGLSP